MRCRPLCLLAAVLLTPATASAADPEWRVEILRTWDGKASLSGEAVVVPPGPAADATAKLELVRGGTVVEERTTAAPVAAGRLTLELDEPPRAGDVVRYRSPADDVEPDVQHTFGGGPTIADDACAGKAGFTGLHGATADVTIAAGASGPGDATVLTGSAASTSATAFSATLDAPLAAGALAWVETTAIDGAVSVASRAERRVLDCATPPGSVEETPPADLTPPPPGPGENVVVAAPAPPPPDVKAPRVTVAAAKGRIKSLVKYGFGYEVRCDEACAATASLVLDAKTARKYKLGRKALVLATATSQLTSGRPVLRFKLKKSVARKLRRAKSLKLQVVTVAVDAAGHRVSATSTASFRR